MAAYKATLNEGEDAREGWWVLAESIRTKPNTKFAPGEEIAHNMLVGRQALGWGCAGAWAGQGMGGGVKVAVGGGRIWGYISR